MMDGSQFLFDIKKQYRYYKYLAEKAFEQIDDQAFFDQEHAEVNSIAIIVKHISGNLVSRFQDFQTTDGEKPWRNRDDEFILHSKNREELMDSWSNAWSVLFRELDQLSNEHMSTRIKIRNQDHSIPTALIRSLTHVSYHIGQILHEAKRNKGPLWDSLSIPIGKSKAFNDGMLDINSHGDHYTDGLIEE